VASFGGDPSINNTFQAVLTSDGKLSFVVFNYGQIGWSNVIMHHIRAGFDSGNNNVFFLINGSSTFDIINLTATSNVNMAGKNVFRVDTSFVYPNSEDLTSQSEHNFVYFLSIFSINFVIQNRF
jgi:hypothetical protein